MKTCRRGHAFEGVQCKVCKAAWERKNRPVRGTLAARREAAIPFKRLPGQFNGKPIALGEWAKILTLDRACKMCHSPTSWGLCSLCAKGMGVVL